jgi:hypothetical protein
LTPFQNFNVKEQNVSFCEHYVSQQVLKELLEKREAVDDFHWPLEAPKARFAVFVPHYVLAQVREEVIIQNGLFRVTSHTLKVVEEFNSMAGLPEKLAPTIVFWASAAISRQGIRRASRQK